jgi:hypothetical protein
MGPRIIPHCVAIFLTRLILLHTTVPLTERTIHTILWHRSIIQRFSRLFKMFYSSFNVIAVHRFFVFFFVGFLYYTVCTKLALFCVLSPIHSGQEDCLHVLKSALIQ